MYTDIYGKKRHKVGLHIHTTRSDGRKTPEESLELYREQGYDAIAFTDHWKYAETKKAGNVTLISGTEFDVGGAGGEKGVFHIVGLFMESQPALDRADVTNAQQIIDAIHAVGGIAVLAHPAWSLNTPDMITELKGVDATEIYNAVSEAGMSFRPDSSLIVDMLACRGVYYPLLATDDTHYYDGIDNGKGFIMVDCPTNEPEELKKAILEGNFYASQGPEVHLRREGNKFIVDCSPASKIYFASNVVWAWRVFDGEGLTHAEYEVHSADKFVRAVVIDADGKSAWTNIIEV